MAQSCLMSLSALALFTRIRAPACPPLQGLKIKVISPRAEGCSAFYGSQGSDIKTELTMLLGCQEGEQGRAEKRAAKSHIKIHFVSM